MAAPLPLLHIIFFLAMTFLPPGTTKFSADVDGQRVVWEQQGSGWHPDSAGHDGGIWSGISTIVAVFSSRAGEGLINEHA